VSLAYAADSAGVLREVHQLLGRYFDGLYTSDADALASVFHPDALYATAAAGPFTRLTMAEYLPIVDAREAPATSGEQRTDAIESIEFAGPAAAMARVRCSIGPKRFTDLLTLVCTGGRWQIIAKVFHVDPAPASSTGA
jgi:hypothetical protein